MWSRSLAHMPSLVPCKPSKAAMEFKTWLRASLYWYIWFHMHVGTFLNSSSIAHGMNSKIIIIENFQNVLAKEKKIELQNALESIIFRALFFFHNFNECDFVMKICMHFKHFLKFATRNSDCVDFFIVHGRSI